MSTKSTKKSTANRRKKKTNHTLLICSAVMVSLIAAAGLTYLGGRAYYSGKFLANTTINGIDVGGMSKEKASEAVGALDIPKQLNVTTVSGKVVSIPTEDFDYNINTEEEVAEIFEKVKHSTWFSGFAKDSDYTFDESTAYDKQKLEDIIETSSWGDITTENAALELTDDGYVVKAEVQGDKIENMDKLKKIIEKNVNKGNFEITLKAKNSCYNTPAILSGDLTEKCEKLNNIFKMQINYDFDYTTETLSGDELVDMLIIDDNGDYTVDEDKAMAYVEKLAKKYDTFDTERTFNSTNRGKITIPTSSDAKYGWWIDQQKTCDELVSMLEDGVSVESVDPIYYEDPSGFVYTGVESARKKNGDIGKTYIEIDLSAQYLWYYKDGKVLYETNIVSGQTTSMARTTLPGVYKLWSKSTNYRMKATNADGESWDTTCNYWNNVSLCGIGLHDTVSRTAFGGSIYTYLGSHGCINMPLSAAKYVYDNVEYGTPVVMYYTEEEWANLQKKAGN